MVSTIVVHVIGLQCPELSKSSEYCTTELCPKTCGFQGTLTRLEKDFSSYKDAFRLTPIGVLLLHIEAF